MSSNKGPQTRNTWASWDSRISESFPPMIAELQRYEENIKKHKPFWYYEAIEFQR